MQEQNEQNTNHLNNANQLNDERYRSMPINKLNQRKPRRDGPLIMDFLPRFHLSPPTQNEFNKFFNNLDPVILADKLIQDLTDLRHNPNPDNFRRLLEKFTADLLQQAGWKLVDDKNNPQDTK